MNTGLIAGRYRLQEKIGEGGIAVVYRAADVSLGRDVAVKILRDELATNPAAVQRFRREAHAAARLQHPNIAQIYDTGVQDSTYYIVMEYLREPDLKRILVEYAPLPLRKAVEVAIQACEAIEYAHNSDVVHRDIKPQNILFTNDGRAKLADFGIASAAAAADPSEGALFLDSAYYISPEQAQGHPPSPQSDLYSLGAVLYEALTGRPPFEGASASELAAKHIRERPRSPRALNANVTPSTEYVVMKALNKDPSRRYRTASEMLHDLRKLQEGVRLERTGVLPMAPDGVTPAPGAQASEPPEPAPAAPVAADVPGGGRLRPVLPEDEGPPLRTAIGVGAALLAILVIVGGITWTRMHQSPPPRVEVPRVVGKTTADAATILAQRNLVLGRETEEEDELRQPGTIISQSPDFGEFEPEGTAVDIVVATGAGTVLVPDVVGQTPEDADAMLKRGELVRGEVTFRYDDVVPRGRIIEQGVRSGTNYPKGGAVDVVVSRGPPLEDDTLEADDELGAGEASGDDPAADEEADAGLELAPVITFSEDEDGVSLKVAVGGRQGPRKITVVKADAEARRMQVLERLVEPGSGLNEVIPIKGAGTIRVYVDDELEHTYEVEPPAVVLSPAVSEGTDTP